MVWVVFDHIQRTGKYLEPEALLVARPVWQPLDNAGLGVESLDKAERDLVFGLATSGDSIPASNSRNTQASPRDGSRTRRRLRSY